MKMPVLHPLARSGTYSLPLPAGMHICFFHLPVSGRRSVFSIKLDFDLQFRDAAVDRSDQVLQQGPG